VRLDLSRVGIVGHSLGGDTAIEAMWRDRLLTNKLIPQNNKRGVIPFCKSNEILQALSLSGL
jgi:hypothetical protein